MSTVQNVSLVPPASTPAVNPNSPTAQLAYDLAKLAQDLSQMSTPPTVQQLDQIDQDIKTLSGDVTKVIAAAMAYQSGTGGDRASYDAVFGSGAPAQAFANLFGVVTVNPDGTYTETGGAFNDPNIGGGPGTLFSDAADGDATHTALLNDLENMVANSTLQSFITLLEKFKG